MKTLIKIVIALLLLTAMFNAARAAFNDYQFSDAVHQGMLFDPRASDQELTDMVVKLAAEYEVPLEASNIAIREQGMDLIIDMTYTDNVVLVPGILARDWTFSPSVSTRLLNKR
jgi:hypothetical protein